jgi:MSHA pilin protein MshD
MGPIMMCLSNRKPAMSIHKHPAKAGQHGFSLIELIMFIVIISVAVVGVLQVLSLTNSRSVDPQLRKQALAIAEGLLEEVQLAHFTFCDPSDPATDSAASPAGCTIPEVVGQERPISRPYDNVNDYVTAFGTATTYSNDAASVPFPTGYVATVTLTPDATLGPAGAQITPADGSPANMNVLRITVTVSYLNGSESVVLDGYRTRYAPNSPP